MGSAIHAYDRLTNKIRKLLSESGILLVKTASEAAAEAGGVTTYETQAVSSYMVPAGDRVIGYQFVGGAGGGELAIDGGPPIFIDEGEIFGEGPFPITGAAILGEGTEFEWSGNIDRHFIRLWTPG